MKYDQGKSILLRPIEEKDLPILEEWVESRGACRGHSSASRLTILLYCVRDIKKPFPNTPVVKSLIFDKPITKLTAVGDNG